MFSHYDLDADLTDLDADPSHDRVARNIANETDDANHTRVTDDLAQHSNRPWGEVLVHDAWIDADGNLQGITSDGWES